MDNIDKITSTREKDSNRNFNVDQGKNEQKKNKKKKKLRPPPPPLRTQKRDEVELTVDSDRFSNDAKRKEQIEQLRTISERFSSLVSGDGFKCARFGATFISPSNEIHCKNDEDSSESKTKPSTE